MNIISQEEKYAQIADAIVMRTHEVHSYDTNIENYTDMLQILSSEWPTHLEHLRNIDPHAAVAQCPIDDIDLLSELQQYDRLSYLLKTEKLERNKSAKLLEILISKLPENIKEEEISKAIARRQTILASQSSNP